MDLFYTVDFSQEHGVSVNGTDPLDFFELNSEECNLPQECPHRTKVVSANGKTFSLYQWRADKWNYLDSFPSYGEAYRAQYKLQKFLYLRSGGGATDYYDNELDALIDALEQANEMIRRGA